MGLNKCLLHGRSLDNRTNMNAWTRNSIICVFYRTKLIPLITSRNPVLPFKTMVVDFDNLARDYLIEWRGARWCGGLMPTWTTYSRHDNSQLTGLNTLQCFELGEPAGSCTINEKCMKVEAAVQVLADLVWNVSHKYDMRRPLRFGVSYMWIAFDWKERLLSILIGRMN